MVLSISIFIFHYSIFQGEENRLLLPASFGAVCVRGQARPRRGPPSFRLGTSACLLLRCCWSCSSLRYLNYFFSFLWCQQMKLLSSEKAFSAQTSPQACTSLDLCWDSQRFSLRDLAARHFPSFASPSCLITFPLRAESLHMMSFFLH